MTKNLKTVTNLISKIYEEEIEKIEPGNPLSETELVEKQVQAVLDSDISKEIVLLDSLHSMTRKYNDRASRSRGLSAAVQKNIGQLEFPEMVADTVIVDEGKIYVTRHANMAVLERQNHRWVDNHAKQAAAFANNMEFMRAVRATEMSENHSLTFGEAFGITDKKKK